MRKIFFIFLIITALSSFSLVALADEYDRDEAFVSWKLMAYAIYPAGYIIENAIVKPTHWLITLPFLKEISGHEELSKIPFAFDKEKTKETEAGKNWIH